jgi:hypothetical protein
MLWKRNPLPWVSVCKLPGGHLGLNCGAV